MHSSLDTLCLTLGDQIRRHRGRLVTVESCTGGGIAQAITAVAGSSDWFDRALVTYSNEAKTALAAVPANLISTHGAVSVGVAEAMATGGLTQSRLAFECSFSIAVTGVAGPGGGSVEKPVGTVCFAWGKGKSDAISLLHSSSMHFDGDRAAIRAQSVRYALETLAEIIV